MTTVGSPTTAPTATALPFARCISTASWLLIVLLSTAAVSRSLSLDSVPAGMWLTYPPRFALAITTGLAACIGIWRRRKLMATILLLLCAALAAQTGNALESFKANTVTQTKHPVLKVMSFNIHNRVTAVADIHNVCQSAGVDVVMFQEVESSECRTELKQQFTDFQFFWPDHHLEYEYSSEGAFTCATGIRRERLATATTPVIETGITGYRTFAVNVPLFVEEGHQDCWFVNVHSTKPFYVAKGLAGMFSKMAWKANRHRIEKLRLTDWLEKNQHLPVIVAGDFNAPAGSFNLKFPSLQSAHTVAGSGSNLTFPSTLPIWGIDHTLGNQKIQFLNYKSLRLPYSDHCAQLATFTVAQSRLKK